MKCFTRHGIWIALGLSVVGCGRDFEPIELQTTGIPASRVGQVVDLEVDLPHLRVQGAKFHGVRLEMRLQVDEVGFGEQRARAIYDTAWIDQRRANVEDLSDGRTTLLFTPGTWSTRRLGPIRIEGTTFELLLDGASSDAGWTQSGVAFESQTNLRGSFQGWRRHRFLVTATDFFSSVGRVAEVALVRGDRIEVRNRLELVSADPVLRVTGGSAFAVNRFTFDNLQRLDPRSDFSTAWQAGVGVGANPHDVLVLSPERGYLTRYEPPYSDVAVFDPRNGGIQSTIPLGKLAENVDGTPRPDRMRLAEGRVFVGLQDIDRTFTRFAEGKLAVIDPATDTTVGVVPLGGKNPGPIEVVRGEDGRERLYVALAGIFPGLQPGELSGGVVVVDPTNLVVEHWALDDDDAGGNVGALAMVDDTLGYVVVSDASFANRVLAFDPVAAVVLRTVRETAELVAEIEVDSTGVLAIPERSFFEPRLCLFASPSVAEESETPIGCAALELPPFSVEALD